MDGKRVALREYLIFNEEIRDILLIENVYYVFVGQKGFFSQIISPLERVRSIFYGWPILLDPRKHS